MQLVGCVQQVEDGWSWKMTTINGLVVSASHNGVICQATETVFQLNECCTVSEWFSARY